MPSCIAFVFSVSNDEKPAKSWSYRTLSSVVPNAPPSTITVLKIAAPSPRESAGRERTMTFAIGENEQEKPIPEMIIANTNVSNDESVVVFQERSSYEPEINKKPTSTGTFTEIASALTSVTTMGAMTTTAMMRRSSSAPAVDG